MQKKRDRYALVNICMCTGRVLLVNTSDLPIGEDATALYQIRLHAFRNEALSLQSKQPLLMHLHMLRS
jgi:hypothetical protein